ncbi:MAG: fumarylacetoacetase [Runella slithyformis]|nr:MAG: fumarylacetoacetase [Runella slithyformis]TAF97859.1 MAG: fumarylacetoacetase [Runella sp.]TAG21995.1 MAG: fumarylacetoacetase [Cytophagales bacterium]TAG38657.1 MAG: fumarylacetoacetase [Cytophagia bacterium]TAF00056.1 MAG: fumarylacetoacetase [Runella slithyformis]
MSIAFGIFSVKNGKKRLAAKWGNWVIDLYALAHLGHFDHLDIKKSVFKNDFLNDFIALGKTKTNAVREVSEAFLSNEQNLENQSFAHHATAVELHLPIRIGDYTDFYSSEQHAFNVGAMFRDPANALLPNWKHLPVAYHGRASSIFVSGTNFHRPNGQINASDTTMPTFSATKRLDIELEMATVIGKPNLIGNAINIDQAEDHVFGFMLFNDWSARDIQRWEYVPLGPFLAKNFFSSLSPWVIPIEVLAPFRTPAETQNPEVLPYLREENRQCFDVNLEVYILPKELPQQEFLISKSNFKYLYWTVAQQIAHHTVNGCNLNVGDLLASGTISGKTPDSYGSLLELTWGGKNPIQLTEGISRTFLEDGDTIVIKGFAEKHGSRVDFGEVRTTVLPTMI